jgi:hypothetical protein
MLITLWPFSKPPKENTPESNAENSPLLKKVLNKEDLHGEPISEYIRFLSIHNFHHF